MIQLDVYWAGVNAGENRENLRADARDRLEEILAQVFANHCQMTIVDDSRGEATAWHAWAAARREGEEPQYPAGLEVQNALPGSGRATVTCGGRQAVDRRLVGSDIGFGSVCPCCGEGGGDDYPAYFSVPIEVARKIVRHFAQTAQRLDGRVPLGDDGEVGEMAFDLQWQE